MSDLISRSALKMAFEEDGHLSAYIEEYIDDAPTIDAVPVVHARWKLNDDGSGTCMECHRRQKNVWDHDNWQNYCGCCGVKMDGGAADG